MMVLFYTSYKKHCELYTEIHDLIAVNSCPIELFKKDKIVLGDNILIKYLKSSSSSSGTFDLDDYAQFTLPAGTYFIDDLNAKIKAAILR